MVKEYSLLPLLLRHTVSHDVCDAPGTTFSAYDSETLLEICLEEKFQCDSELDHLRIYVRRGGYLKGSQCFVACGLFVSGIDHPVACLSVHFNIYSPTPELYIKSTSSKFEWSNLPPTMKPRCISEHVPLNSLPTEIFATRSADLSSTTPLAMVLSMLWC